MRGSPPLIVKKELNVTKSRATKGCPKDRRPLTEARQPYTRESGGRTRRKSHRNAHDV